LITASNISTFSISTNNLAVGAGVTTFANLVTHNAGITVTGTNSVSIGGALTVAGTLSTNLITASNISTFSISTNNAYVTTLTVGSEIDTGALSVGGTLSTNLITASNISTFSISTNNAYAATLYAGATVISNTLSVSGANATTLGGSLSVAGTVSTNFITSSNISTNGISTNNAYIGTLIVGSEIDTGALSVGGTLSTNLITASNISTNSISTNNAYLTSVSTLNLDMKAGNVSSLSFYDIVTSSTGTFRFSTLTASGLTALPPVSLLYFNNFVIAGAYVWPGQTIAALDSYTVSNTTVTRSAFIDLGNVSNQTFAYAGGGGGPRSICLASTISGGTAPYFIQDTSLGGISLCNNNLAFYNVAYGTNTFAYIAGTCGTLRNTAIVALTDSSVPPFVRYISVKIG
jgi:hypothetical protein